MKKPFLILLMLLIPLQFVFGCGRLGEIELTKYEENGHFEYTFEGNAGSISIDTNLYPNIEIYINKSLLIPSVYKNELHYYLYEKYGSEYFPSKISISVLQNGKEIYSAKWKIKDVTYSLPEKLSPFLLAFSSLVTAISFVFCLIGIFINKFHKAKWFFIGSVIADFIFLILLFSASC